MNRIKKVFSLTAGLMLLMNISQAQHIKNITFSLTFKKTYLSEVPITVAGKGMPVILSGNGKTGASITLQSNGPVTLDGGFTVQPGATLNILANTGNTAVPALDAPVKMERNDLLIYPNPVSHKLTVFTLQWDNRIKKQLTISDLSGKPVKKQMLQPGITQLDVSALQRGTYLVIISGSDNTQQIRKIVLQ